MHRSIYPRENVRRGRRPGHDDIDQLLAWSRYGCQCNAALPRLAIGAALAEHLVITESNRKVDEEVRRKRLPGFDVFIVRPQANARDRYTEQRPGWLARGNHPCEIGRESCRARVCPYG